MSISQSLTTPPWPHTDPAGPSVAARRLGYAGLIPFVAGALFIWLVWPEAHPFATLALSTYAAVIISFLGGVNWGLAMRQPQPPTIWFVWGAVPPLLAWPAVMMVPGSGLVIQGVLLLVCYGVDRRLYPAQGVAGWLMLRFRLSAIAALSCFIGAAGA